MGIANEPDCKFATACVLMLRFKGPIQLPYLLCIGHVPLYLALPCFIYSTLPLSKTLLLILILLLLLHFQTLIISFFIFCSLL